MMLLVIHINAAEHLRIRAQTYPSVDDPVARSLPLRRARHVAPRAPGGAFVSLATLPAGFRISPFQTVSLLSVCRER